MAMKRDKGAELALLEAALLEYVEKFGLTPTAREIFTESEDVAKPVTKPYLCYARE